MRLCGSKTTARLAAASDLSDAFIDKPDFVAYGVLPEDQRLFDPAKAHEMYIDYLDELEYAAQMGFDGICVNEHHQNAYGLMPSPNLMANTLYTGTWTYTLDSTNANTWKAGAYSTTVTYTAAGT